MVGSIRMPKKNSSVKRVSLSNATKNKYAKNIVLIRKQLTRKDISPAQRNALTRQLKSLQNYL